MKKLLMTLVALGASVSVAHAGQYLQASSSVTQCPGKAPKLVEMDIVDAANGITLANNKVTVGEAGPYLIVAAPQVGREGGGPYGCFDLWLRVNGTDVANSNVQLCQDEGSMAKDVIISQGIVSMEAGDVLEVMMSASNPDANMCIEAIQPAGGAVGTGDHFLHDQVRGGGATDKLAGMRRAPVRADPRQSGGHGVTEGLPGRIPSVTPWRRPTSG